jgi:hypothetical protein
MGFGVHGRSPIKVDYLGPLGMPERRGWVSEVPDHAKTAGACKPGWAQCFRVPPLLLRKLQIQATTVRIIG